MEPPYTERYVRWCERSGVNHPLLLDLDQEIGKKCVRDPDKPMDLTKWI